MLLKKSVFVILAMLLSSCATAHKDVVSGVPSPHPFEADYYYMRGYEAFISGEWDETLAQYRKALEYDPKSPFLRVQIGHLLFRKGEVSEALALAEGVVRDYPDNIKALMLLTEIYSSQKRSADAVAALGRVKGLASADDPEVMMFLGKAYYSHDMTDEALAAFIKAAENDPHEFIAMDYIGSIYLEKKEYDKAEEYLKKVLEVRPLESVHFKLGVIHELQERYPEAIGDYEAALRLNPANNQARERVAQVYVRQKATAKAIEEFLTLSRQQPENADLHVRLGMLYYEARDYERSLEEFRVALAAAPDNTTIRYYLALVLEETDRLDESAAEFRRIILREPKNINAFLHLAIIYSKQKREDESIKMFEEILEFDREKPEVFLSLGIAYSRKKDYAKAEKILKEAVEKFRDNDDLYLNLAMVYDKSEKQDDMIASLRKAIEINPRNADALNYLGYYFADKNINLIEAKELIERALELKPDNGYILDSYGWVLFRLGDNEKAIENLEKALTLSGDDPVLFEHLGDAYHAVRRDGKALEYWQGALERHEKEEGLKERVEKKIRELNGK